MELFRLFGRIAIDNSEANDAMNDTANKGSGMHSKLSGVFGKVGSLAVKAGKVIATGLAAAGTAIVALGKKSLDAYAEYEQLCGGVETLFKSSANTIKQYAANAYKTAGLSANEYMSTVTSFASSLIQSCASTTSSASEASIDALEAQYEAAEEMAEQEMELLEEAHDAEIEAYEKLTDQKIALINQQYTEALKLIDEEKYNKLKAIDAEIDALNAQTEAEKEALEKKAQEDKIAALEEKVNAAETAEEKKKAEEDLADYLAELEQKEREKQRKKQIESLKEQKEIVKEEADAKKEVLKEQQKAEIALVEEQAETQLKLIKKRQDAEIKELEKANKQKLKATKKFIDEQSEMLGSSSAVVVSAEAYAEAAEVANRAIIDMADNANKMGTSMESIQNAYQGFAKQNYTMLDNLKLGYGGTKTEMQRLIQDASKMTEIQERLGITVDSSSMSFENIVNAIHVMQESMGIAGATQAEAATTIQGSLASMKAAWSNLITGLGDDQADLDVLINNFVDSFLVAAKNILPRLEKILGGMADVVAKIMPIISAKLPELVQSLLPALIKGATALFIGFVKAFPTFLQILIEQIPVIVTEIGNALIEAFPVLLQTCKDLFGQIWDYIAVELLGTSNDFDTTMQDIATFFDNAWVVLQDIWVRIGQPIFNMVQNSIKTVRDVFAQRMPEIQGFVSSVFDDIVVIWENNLKPCLEAIGNFIEGVLAPTIETVFNDIIAPVFDTVFAFIQDLWENTLKPVFVGIIDFLTGVFSGDWEKAWEGVKSILTGILNGILAGIEGMINGAIKRINGLIEGINGLVTKAGEVIGLDIEIPTIPEVNLPRLEKGGVLERGQIGLLEGNGAEAVVPLENNSKWISAVANDMQTQGIGGGTESLMVLREILALLKELKDEGAEMLLDAIAGGLKLDINNREFARLVKAVN